VLVLNKYDWHTEQGEYVGSILQQYLGRTEFLRPIQLILLRCVNSLRETEIEKVNTVKNIYF
jgi:hypothetical protein